MPCLAPSMLQFLPDAKLPATASDAGVHVPHLNSSQLLQALGRWLYASICQQAAMSKCILQLPLSCQVSGLLQALASALCLLVASPAGGHQTNTDTACGSSWAPGGRLFIQWVGHMRYGRAGQHFMLLYGC